MISATLITPDHTELAMIRGQFEAIKDFTVLRGNDELEKVTKNVLIDLSFDFFDSRIKPSFLYGFFSEIQPLLDSIKLMDVNLFIIKNYPFSTDFQNLLMAEKVLSQFIHLLIEYYNAKLILMPNLISRYSLGKIKHPAVNIMNSAKSGKSYRSPVRENSRVALLYAVDFISVLCDLLEEGVDSHLVVEGIEMNLKAVCETCHSVAGNSPVHFDSNHFVQYHYPNITGHAVNHINYGLENMMIDLVDRLF